MSIRFANSVVFTNLVGRMYNIRGEIPQFKRCCMCLPLRHGLIAWGYIRLVLGVILLIGVSKGFFQMLAISKNEDGYAVYVVMFGFFVIVGGADIVLNVVFVYAGHTKHLQMLKAYYIYCFILWILTIIMGISLSAYAVHVMKTYHMDVVRVWIILVDVVAFLAHIVIQAYVILLVRSEFIKLTRDCEFRFVNNAAESACKMKCEDDNIANGDIIADGNITANRAVNTYEDMIATTYAMADGDTTTTKNIIDNGDKKGVYTNRTSEYIDTMTY